MRYYEPIRRQACCIYCHKEFIIEGKQRWHDCKLATAAKRKYNAVKAAEWRKRTGYKQGNRKTGPRVGDKSNYKKCKKCKVLTINYFGICDGCISEIGTQCDLEMTLAFERGC